jgi:FkbM family methyltransferase
MHLKSIRLMGSLMLNFRNGGTLVQRMRAGLPCDELALWDGTRIEHPKGRLGLLEAVQEIWLERIYTNGFYRPANGDAIVDAGANIGLFAISIASRNPRCRVIALEPFPENFKYLQANVARARLNNVSVHEMALGAALGRGQMEAVGTRSLDHVLRVNSNLTSAKSNANGTPVIPLAGIFDLTHTSEVDFLKMDIEGSEHDVFANASSGLVGRFKRIAMEYHDRIVPGTLALVQRVLSPTHELTIRPSQMEGCGILLARRRDL